MYSEFTARTEALLGTAAVKKIREAHVAVFGLGGVGSWAAEALARTGIGHLTLVDGDVVSESNINRQLPALSSTVGKDKCSVLENRFRDINPNIIIHSYKDWYKPGQGEYFLKSEHSVQFVIDCIDDVKSKADLIFYCAQERIPIITAGGCARRLHSQELQFRDIFSTSGDPLLKRLRKELKELGVNSLPVISSSETARKNLNESESDQTGGIASYIFVPAVCGLQLAQHACLYLADEYKIPLPTLRQA